MFLDADDLQRILDELRYTRRALAKRISQGNLPDKITDPLALHLIQREIRSARAEREKARTA